MPESVNQPRDATRRALRPGAGWGRRWLAVAVQHKATELPSEHAAAGEIFPRENGKLCRIIGSGPKSGMKLYFKRGTGEGKKHLKSSIF